MNRREIEARARAEDLVREELARLDVLQSEAADLESRAGLQRRLVAAIAGSRLAGLLAGDRSLPGRKGSDAERRSAQLRRRRFRLTRRKRVLEPGARHSLREERQGPLWLTDLSREAIRASGPNVRQRILADLLAGGGESCSRAARILVDARCPPAVAEDVKALGLERAINVAGADLAIVAEGDGKIGFDWILTGQRSVASAAGLGGPLGSSPAELGEALATAARAATFCIRVASRDWEAASYGGDAALAGSLARALGERGHQALLQVGAEAGNPAAECLDVLLVLRGRPAGEPTSGRVNLLWQISHPEETSAAELERYDRVLVASRRHAECLRGTIGAPVETLLQFTDPALFHPTPGTEPAHDLAFVGNWRGEFRRIVWDALEAGRPPALYGRGWDLLAPAHAVAEHVPHEELHRLYSSCAILLCDHWDDMRRRGFVSNKVLDALACETFVIADDNPALAEELPGAVETYSSPTDLREKIDRYLSAPEARRRIARRGRELTLAEHTVGKRAEQLLAIAAETARGCARPAVAQLAERGAPAGDASAAAAVRRGAGAGST